MKPITSLIAATCFFSLTIACAQPKWGFCLIQRDFHVSNQIDSAHIYVGQIVEISALHCTDSVRSAENRKEIRKGYSACLSRQFHQALVNQNPQNQLIDPADVYVILEPISKKNCNELEDNSPCFFKSRQQAEKERQSMIETLGKSPKTGPKKNILFIEI
jgi:hypothetical protein